MSNFLARFSFVSVTAVTSAALAACVVYHVLEAQGLFDDLQFVRQHMASAEQLNQLKQQTDAVLENVAQLKNVIVTESEQQIAATTANTATINELKSQLAAGADDEQIAETLTKLEQGNADLVDSIGRVKDIVPNVDAAADAATSVSETTSEIAPVTTTDGTTSDVSASDGTTADGATPADTPPVTDG